jgi:hypothetical protein
VLCGTCEGELRAGYKGKYYKRRVVGVRRLKKMIKDMEAIRDGVARARRKLSIEEDGA